MQGLVDTVNWLSISVRMEVIRIVLEFSVRLHKFISCLRRNFTALYYEEFGEIRLAFSPAITGGFDGATCSWREFVTGKIYWMKYRFDTVSSVWTVLETSLKLKDIKYVSLYAMNRSGRQEIKRLRYLKLVSPPYFHPWLSRHLGSAWSQKKRINGIIIR